MKDNIICDRWSSAVVALLKAGADPNLADEFSNVSRVARERDLNSLQGKKQLNQQMPSPVLEQRLPSSLL